MESTKVEATSWRQYYALTKPKVVYLIVFTALVGMLLATRTGMPPWNVLLFGTLGIGLAAASGAAINQIVDEHIDGIMARTENRPLPKGEVDRNAALTFALSLAVISMIMLTLFVNLLTALLTLISLVGYAVIYTMYLKRMGPQNIVWGGAAGATPPVLGWTAVSGEIHTEALLLFLVIFVWTPPHFWALAIKRRAEYAKAGIPMLPVTHGVLFTKQQILMYTIMLVSVTLLPFVINMSGLIYLSGAVALGVGFLWFSLRLYRAKESDQAAIQTFAYSIIYLSLLFGFLLLDHYLRVVFHWVAG
ncbi:MAG: protoheme IX farnesyltransferase [Gammaproteobacteria bacterium]|nr:protoheme IX farnesyltransferase [Gammaproteobacteria bacterium]MBT5234796.1 protoheme IX farnesyltransferase [Candidatus Neomarinimicrobiota bacterium]MBT3717907.1 protoheme IX farnesyltransferase [Gammaproteobacteria bacterium]MBT3846241.1 protoheme IX farnesyltransferase [Gammaproteobacteria bacterium]MBT3893206.1 protoheme IX farnesyltransferase [Gammaproteobacteria bacterium]